MNYAIIHISDIHFKADRPESASLLLNALINDLKSREIEHRSYKVYIAITGDIVSRGMDSDAYIAFINEFDEKLKNIKIFKGNRIIVPGNHDIDRNMLKKDLESYQKELYKNIEIEEKFNNFLSDGKLKENLFENYLLFDSEFAKYGLDANPLGKGWAIDDNTGIYCLNTALCSFGGLEDIKDKKKLAINTRGLIEWCTSTKTKNNILFMHHPLSHLNHWSKEELKSIIENYFALCLSGHNHEQDLYHNKISNKSLICSAPPLFTKKQDLLGYSILYIENGYANRILYRQYIRGQFLNGLAFSQTDDGVVQLPNNYSKCLEFLENTLEDSLTFFKNQPVFFIKPKLSKEREFNNEENLLDGLIKEPKSTIIAAQPQFGLTVLSKYMRLEAFLDDLLWVYIDAKRVKSRRLDKAIEEQLSFFDKPKDEIKCIIIDSWNGTIIDHGNLIKKLDKEYPGIPLIIMTKYSEIHFQTKFDFSTLTSEFEVLHLQALQRKKVREFVSKYNKLKNIGKEDLVVTKVVKDLEALNVHRTPANLLTLLKAFERNFNEDILNRTKMIQAVMFILFTDSESFTYASTKPDVDDCEYILGSFCKSLIKKHNRKFPEIDFVIDLRKFCKDNYIHVDIDILIDILVSNNILIRYNEELEFKHSYWIYYFAAAFMYKDEGFRSYILSNKEYVNFPEIIEFYTGIDNQRNDAIEILLDDLTKLNSIVHDKIGIPGDFNPFSEIVWKPSDGTIEAIKEEISEKVQKSKLPTLIKDQHADQCYDSEAPYDQSIKQFLSDYSVLSLFQGIKASSRALRNSKYINLSQKKAMMKAILNGWEQISRVIFWLSPALAQNKRVAFEGFGLFLLGHKDESCENLLKKIYESNPFNVVNYFKDNISSTKMGPLFFDFLNNNDSELQRHFIAHFLIRERPIGWYTELFDFMNLLHRNSFYLGDLYDALALELRKGFVSDHDIKELKKIGNIIVAKHKAGSKQKIEKIGVIPKNMTINENNKIPIDKILALMKTPPFVSKK